MRGAALSLLTILFSGPLHAASGDDDPTPTPVPGEWIPPSQKCVLFAPSASNDNVKLRNAAYRAADKWFSAKFPRPAKVREVRDVEENNVDDDGDGDDTGKQSTLWISSRSHSRVRYVHGVPPVLLETGAGGGGRKVHVLSKEQCAAYRRLRGILETQGEEPKFAKLLATTYSLPGTTKRTFSQLCRLLVDDPARCPKPKGRGTQPVFPETREGVRHFVFSFQKGLLTSELKTVESVEKEAQEKSKREEAGKQSSEEQLNRRETSTALRKEADAASTELNGRVKKPAEVSHGAPLSTDDGLDMPGVKGGQAEASKSTWVPGSENLGLGYDPFTGELRLPIINQNLVHPVVGGVCPLESGHCKMPRAVYIRDEPLADVDITTQLFSSRSAYLKQQTVSGGLSVAVEKPVKAPIADAMGKAELSLGVGVAAGNANQAGSTKRFGVTVLNVKASHAFVRSNIDSYLDDLFLAKCKAVADAGEKGTEATQAIEDLVSLYGLYYVQETDLGGQVIVETSIRDRNTDAMSASAISHEVGLAVGLPTWSTGGSWADTKSDKSKSAEFQRNNKMVTRVRGGQVGTWSSGKFSAWMGSVALHPVLVSPFLKPIDAIPGLPCRERLRKYREDKLNDAKKNKEKVDLTVSKAEKVTADMVRSRRIKKAAKCAFGIHVRRIRAKNDPKSWAQGTPTITWKVNFHYVASESWITETDGKKSRAPASKFGVPKEFTLASRYDSTKAKSARFTLFERASTNSKSMCLVPQQGLLVIEAELLGKGEKGGWKRGTWNKNAHAKRRFEIDTLECRLRKAVGEEIAEDAYYSWLRVDGLKSGAFSPDIEWAEVELIPKIEKYDPNGSNEDEYPFHACAPRED